jgi:ABC-type transport system substrate-binding protein
VPTGLELAVAALSTIRWRVAWAGSAWLRQSPPGCEHSSAGDSALVEGGNGLVFLLVPAAAVQSDVAVGDGPVGAAVTVPTDEGPITLPASFNVLDQIYEPLVRYGPNGTLQPGLAERWR